MRVLLLNPPRCKRLLVIREERCEIIEGSSIMTPYSLLQIGSLVENKVKEVKLIDANALDLSYQKLEEMMENIDYDVLIFKFTPTSFEEDIKVAKISKKIKPNAKTVGICYSLWPIAKQVMQDAKDLDVYIGHEYDAVTSKLIDNMNKPSNVDGIAYRSNNKIIVNKDAKPLENYDSLPIPAFHLLPSLDPYYISVNHGKPFSMIYTSKGCPYVCMYCNVSRSKVKLKSVDRIMKEIDYLKKNYNVKTLSLFDETFTLDKERVVEFCKRIKEYNIKWYCNTRTSLVTLPLLKIMRDAGCKAVSYGIESGSQKILDNVSKRVTVEQHARAIKWAHEAGIKTHCSFIFGLPGETKETIKETLDFVKKTLPMSIEFNIATLYPGTMLYDYAIKEGWIGRNVDWRKLYQDSAQFKGRNLSNEYLEKVRRRAHTSLYFNPRWFFKNLAYTIKNPDDFILAYRYVIKVLKDIFVRKYSVVKNK